MSSSMKTKNLGMNLFIDTDVVDFNDINKNFNVLDALPFCVKSGVTTATYQQYILKNGNENTAYGNPIDVKWNYKIYNDKTFEMYAKIELTTLSCTAAIGSLFRSGYLRVYLPNKYSDGTMFNIAEVSDLNINMSSDSYDWIILTNGPSIVNNFTFRIVGPKKETYSVYRQIFVNVKGVIS